MQHINKNHTYLINGGTYTGQEIAEALTTQQPKPKNNCCNQSHLAGQQLPDGRTITGTKPNGIITTTKNTILGPTTTHIHLATYIANNCNITNYLKAKPKTDQT